MGLAVTVQTVSPVESMEYKIQETSLQKADVNQLLFDVNLN